MKQVNAIIIVLILSVVAPQMALATETVEVGGFEFDSVHRTVQADIPLRGQGLLRYMGFIKAYAGALYMPSDVDPEKVLDSVPRRLELVYYHAITADDFAQATRKKMADNVSETEMTSLAARLEQFNSLYRDVQPGDRYALTYLPGRGTELSLNGQQLGIVPGDDFAAAVFAIWLGPKPIDRSFKKALLGVT